MIELRFVVERSENKSGFKIKPANRHLTAENKTDQFGEKRKKTNPNSTKRKRQNDLNIFEETM